MSRRKQRPKEQRTGSPSLTSDTSFKERLLDVHEASAILGLKPGTLYQWAYERRIPVVT